MHRISSKIKQFSIKIFFYTNNNGNNLISALKQFKTIKNGWRRLGTVGGRKGTVGDGDGREGDAARIGIFAVLFDWIPFPSFFY